MNFGISRKKEHYICPYCFSKHSLNDVGFTCSNAPEICANAKEGKIIKFKNEDNRNVMPEYAFCNECGSKTNIKVCPTCGAELPYGIGEHEELIFAVIGAKESGKSHYIAVLIDKIKNEIGSAFNCSLNAIDDATINRYRNDFYNPVFKRSELIGVTRSAKTDSSVKQPLIYTLTFKGKQEGLFGSKKISKVVTIAFFDTAGEDLDSEDTMKTVSRYIYNSSGIIFLLDPLQLENVRETLPDGTPLPEQNTEIEDLLSRTANLIRKANEVKMDELIDIPVAVAFSKLDAVEPLIDPSSCVNYPSNHTSKGYFDLVDFEDMNGTMESLVRSWGGENFANQLSSNFKDYGYFGLTALGSNPESNKIAKLRPHRVEDPFLWLLYKYKLIKAEKRK